MIHDKLSAEIDLILLKAERLSPITYRQKREAAHQRRLASKTNTEENRHAVAQRKLERKNTRETQNYLAAKKREARLQWSANNPGCPFPRKLVQQAKQQEIALLNDEAPSDRAI